MIAIHVLENTFMFRQLNFAIRFEAIPSRLEAIASRSEAIASRLEASRIEKLCHLNSALGLWFCLRLGLYPKGCLSAQSGSLSIKQALSGRKVHHKVHSIHCGAWQLVQILQIPCEEI